ncbi:lamin tail domain-containing protein [Verrucomicrobiota bacterium sgz303538]
MKVSPRTLSLLVSFAVLLASASTVTAQFVISEFMATNTNTTIVDEDGSHSDWIEIQNNGTANASLNGWYITDDPGDLRKWQFPATTPALTLAPGARLLVWASNKDRKLAANRLHTNFRLDGAGEYLALVRPDGLTVEHGYIPKYPPQATDVSFGISGGRQWSVLVGPTLTSDWKVRVPQDATDFTTMANWNTDPAFVDTTWATKRTLVSGGIPKGIGYDSGGANGARAFLINYSGSTTGAVASTGDLGSNMTVTGMYNTGTVTGVPTLCMRAKFNVADPATIQELRLNVRYDDGFIVYLNGTEILRVNAPATVAWNSAAASDREDDQSESYETFSLAGAQQYLVAGTNLLAIHGFNEAKNSGHFVITPSFEAFQTVSGATGGTPGYLSSPTPGGENTTASTAIGPDISQTTNNPVQPVGGVLSGPLLVTARVRQTLNPISSVVCRYVINFGAESSLTMRDDGTAGDVTAGDGIYSALVPTASLAAGHLLRWRILATDNAANQSTDPPYRDPFDNDQYFGTMAQTPTIQSQLPIVYWFHNTASTNVFATNENGFRSSLFYKLPTETSGRFYDNVRFNLHGQSTAGFGKKSQNVNFNADNRFKWKEGEKEIRGMNLLSNWADKAHVRNALAWETWNLTKHPSHWCQPVRIQQITSGNLNSGIDAQFLCLSDMVEDANAEFMERWGLDPNGALYKCYNSLNDTTQTSSTNGGGVEKKTREWENFSDLQALVDATNPNLTLTVRRKWLYDNVDIPALINYLAVHNLIQSHDFGHKNYYIYRDTNGTGEWKLLPWDQDLSFGHRWTSSQGYFDDDLDSANSIFIGGGGNQVMRIVNTSGANELAQMYLRRLRTLMDRFYGPPAAPVNHFVSRIDSYLDLLDPPSWPVTTDAERDFLKWGFWVDGSGTKIDASDSRAVNHRIRATAVRIKTTNDTTIYPGSNPYSGYGSNLDTNSSLNPFIPGRRDFLYNRNPTIIGQSIPAAQPATPNLAIQNVTVNPGGIPNLGVTDQQGEYFIIRNANSYAVDLSDWQITGAVNFTFPPGTVIPAVATSTSDGSSASYVNQLVVAKNSARFRARTASPKGNEYRLVVGGYDGQLSARGGTIELRNAAGTLITSATYLGSPTEAQKNLRITELNYAPAAPTAAETAALPGVQASDFEFIELINNGMGPLDLSGARFDRGITFVFPNIGLPPGGRVIIVSNRAAFTLRYGISVSTALQFEGNLDNSGERLRLLDSVGEVILDFTYDPAWYSPTMAGGYTLVSRSANPSYNSYDAATTWAISGQTGGTPGNTDSSFSQTFEGWRHDYFTSGQEADVLVGGINADAETDGATNLAEYAFGKDPRTSDSDSLVSSSVVNVGGSDYLGITFLRRTKALDLNYVVEASTDLTSWTPVDLPVGSPQSAGTGLERVTFRDNQPVGSTARFLRVRAVKQ